MGDFLSGMLLVLSKPFSKGQYVKVQITTSTIIEGTIDARYTYIRAEDNGTRMVPSSLVYSSAFLVGPAKKKTDNAKAG
jgi:small-conductance mechanosensitive channel